MFCLIYIVMMYRQLKYNENIRFTTDKKYK